MKKNLRIVSAAAAALLAIAPVAASTVSVNAANAGVSDINSNNTNPNNTINWGVGSLASNADINVKPNLTLNVANKLANTKNQLTGTINATVNGSTYNALYAPGQTSVQIFHKTTDAIAGTNAISKDDSLTAGTTYFVKVDHLQFNFGTANANKALKLDLGSNSFSYDMPSTSQEAANATAAGVKALTNVHSGSVWTEADGSVTLKDVVLAVTARDLADPATVQFVNRATGVPVSSGDVSLVANANGEANTATVAAAINAKYAAMQVRWENGSLIQNNETKQEVTTASDVAAALKAANIDVQANGFFKAPHSLVVNASATSSINTAKAQLPVTVTFSNVAAPAPETVNSVSKRVMHNAYYYDKDGKRVGTDRVTRYNSVDVLPNTTTFGGKTYYQVVENGKATDKYINAANIDGTKRTLKHNAYVYATSKKRANKVVLKKGEVVTTYGASYTFKNGQKYYKIGDNTDKTYVKVANFR